MAGIEEWTAHLTAVRGKKTAEAYTLAARKFETFIGESGKLEPSTLADFAAHLSAKGMAAASVQLNTIGARQYAEFLRQRGVKVPAFGKPDMPKIEITDPPDLSDATIEGYMACAGDYPEPVCTALRLLPLTGVRVDECCTLRLDGVAGTPQGYVLQVGGKSKRWRQVPLLGRGAVLLKRFLLDARGALAGDVYLFPSSKGGPLRKAVLQEAIREIRVRLGVPDMTAHTLRHTYATRLTRAKVPTAVVARLLGHESTQTTQRYIHSDTADLFGAVAMLREPWAR